MTQNIFDDPTFFTGYSHLNRSVKGLSGAPEWPALRAMLPPMCGRRVVDLGCGFGWFCRWAREAGAAHLLGIDISQNMLARAHEMNADPAIVYQRTDLEKLSLPTAAFDLAYSSLALHYVENLEALLLTVHRALMPGGHLVFSVDHPIVTAAAEPCWTKTMSGCQTWPVDHYLEEGLRSTDWLTKGVIKQHRPIATYLNLLLRLGFSLQRIEEWGPSDTQIAARPDTVSERQRPPFLLVSARR